MFASLGLKGELTAQEQDDAVKELGNDLGCPTECTDSCVGLFGNLEGKALCLEDCGCYNFIDASVEGGEAFYNNHFEKQSSSTTAWTFAFQAAALVAGAAGVYAISKNSRKPEPINDELRESLLGHH